MGCGCEGPCALLRFSVVYGYHVVYVAHYPPTSAFCAPSLALLACAVLLLVTPAPTLS